MVPTESVEVLAEKLAHQREITIDYRVVEGADHFFNTKVDEMTEQLDNETPGAADDDEAEDDEEEAEDDEEGGEQRDDD